MRCLKCGADNRQGRKFCAECAAPLVRTCAECGSANEPNEKFCGECGAALTPAGAGGAQSSPTLSSGPSIRVTSGPTETVAQASDLDGERKTVTALFADIRGSTELLERLDPEEARALIDPALKLMIDAVNHYDGYIVQSTGDGIFAVFGAPVAHEDHPQRALYAALRLQDELRRYSAGLRARGGSPIEARAGVNTGEVVVRSIRAGEQHSEYAPVGHTANLASPMQTIAASGSIVVTANTSALVEGYFRLRSLGQVTLKGIAEPVNAYEVIGLGPLRTRLQRAVGRGLTKFIGRETELKQMKHALELARDGHGQIVAAIGEPGVGKSRLLYEFKAVTQAGNQVLEAYSVSHGKASAYLPVTEMLRDYFRIVPDDEIRQRREKVAGKIAILDRALEDTLPYIYALLGIADSDGPLPQIDAEIRRRRTCEAIKRVLLRESLNQPLIVIFEDLHWIDRETQAVLDLLAESIASARILLLVNYRPEYRHEWGRRTYYTQLRLDPLGRESADEMLSELLGDAPELAALKRTIAERTEGNPFFVEEIFEALVEQGVLTRNGRVKLARPFSGITLPTTVQGMLASRIDRLAPKEKELLQALAAIGREFPLSLAKQVWEHPLPRVTAPAEQEPGAAPLAPLVAPAPQGRLSLSVSAGGGLSELDQMLGRLQSSEFIYEQPAAGDAEYRFKHALTLEVAYGSLLIEHRKLLHERIGDAMESLFADRIDDHLKDIAHHYRRSGNTAKAIDYLRRAGEQAIARTFYEEAIEQLNGALELLQKVDPGDARNAQELAIRRSLMAPMAAVRVLGSIEVQENSNRLLELCKEAGEGRLAALVLVHLFFIYRGMMDRETFVREVLELADHTSDEYQIFCGNFVAGLWAAEKGEYLSARRHLERASGIGPQAQAAIIADRSIALGLPNCLGHLAFVLWILGYSDKAREPDRRIVSLLQAPLDPYAHVLGAYHVVGLHCDFLRDNQIARAEPEEGLTQSIRHGLHVGTAFGLLSLGRVMVAEGDFDDGIAKIAEGLRALDTAGGLDNYGVSSHMAASACLQARHTAEGLDIVDRAIAKVAVGGVWLFEADLYRLRGEFLLMAGRPEKEAEAAFREAITIARQRQAKSFELRATICLARLLARQGRREEARTMLAEIYGWFTEGFDTADLKDAKALLDELNLN
jgi:class 3 adenylate cyclase/tetratricopeptide (TPR) repeat protein